MYKKSAEIHKKSKDWVRPCLCQTLYNSKNNFNNLQGSTEVIYYNLSDNLKSSL